MDVTAWAIALMEFLGGPGTALVIASEALFPPIPGEVLLPFAGVTAAANDQHVLVPIFWTTLGSVLGGLGVYGVGRALGVRLVAEGAKVVLADINQDRLDEAAALLAEIVLSDDYPAFLTIPAYRHLTKDTVL